MFNALQFNTSKYNALLIIGEIVTTLVISRAIPLHVFAGIVALSAADSTTPDVDNEDIVGLTASDGALALPTNNGTVILG